MAITQQILRISDDTLEKARRDTRVLDDLISFRLVSRADSLDLDWAPSGLKRLASSTLTPSQQSALSCSFEGSAVLNPQHPDGPEPHDVYSDITFLSPDQVRSSSNSLQGIDVEHLVSAVPGDREAQALFFKMTEAFLPSNPKTYFREQFLALREFLRVAASLNMALVMWWD